MPIESEAGGRLCNLCGYEVEFEFVFWSVFVPPTYSHNSDSEVA